MAYFGIPTPVSTQIPPGTMSTAIFRPIENSTWFQQPPPPPGPPIPTGLRRVAPGGGGTAGAARSCYELWLTRDDGTRLAVLDDWLGLEYTLSVGEVGSLSLSLPGDWSTALFAADRKVEVWRKPEGGAMALERAFLISGIEQVTDQDGQRTITLQAVDGLDLLRRRIVAYAAGSTGAKVTAACDSLMKDVVWGNLSTACTDTDRALSTAYFSVEPKSSAGPSVAKEFARREVLATLQELSAASKETTGPVTYFDVVSPTPASYQFVTRSDQLGLDHSYPSGVNPVLLGLEYGNLVGPQLSEDYSEEATVIYGGGGGRSTGRDVYEIEDAARSGRSLWGRKERFQDARTAATSSALMDEARSALDEGRPTIKFSGGLVDSPGTLYGVHWRWGDRVTASYGGQTYDCTLDVVRVRRDAQGETVEARLGYDEP